jgi:hypothetical protein
MDQLQVAVWPPKRIVQSACPANINSPTTDNHIKKRANNDVSRDISICMSHLMHCLLVQLLTVAKFMCGQDFSSTKMEGKGHKTTMSNVIAAISVSFVGPIIPTFLFNLSIRATRQSH